LLHCSSLTIRSASQPASQPLDLNLSISAFSAESQRLKFDLVFGDLRNLHDKSERAGYNGEGTKSFYEPSIATVMRD